MAKAETSPTAISWPPEGLPIDVACKSIMPPLWAAYVKAQDAARGVDDLLSRIRILSLGADRERLLAEREKARRELDAERDRLLEEGEFELWGRPENPWAEPQRIPASALRLSCLDYERRTAAGEGWLLHDLRLAVGEPLVYLEGPTSVRARRYQGRRRDNPSERCTLQKIPVF